MKKNILMFLLIVTMMFSLVGCAKCISTEYENVEVNVVDEYHRDTYTVIEYNAALKMPTTRVIPGTYEITVEYNDVEYTISDSDTYDKYEDKVGQTAIGTLEIRNYDDGTTRYDIISLEW